MKSSPPVLEGSLIFIHPHFLDDESAIGKVGIARAALGFFEVPHFPIGPTEAGDFREQVAEVAPVQDVDVFEPAAFVVVRDVRWGMSGRVASGNSRSADDAVKSSCDLGKRSCDLPNSSSDLAKSSGDFANRSGSFKKCSGD